MKHRTPNILNDNNLLISNKKLCICRQLIEFEKKSPHSLTLFLISLIFLLMIVIFKYFHKYETPSMMYLRDFFGFCINYSLNHIKEQIKLV